MTSFLTKNRDVDIKILLELDDKDLQNISLFDEFTFKLYNDDLFWKMKFLKTYDLTEANNDEFLFDFNNCNLNWKMLLQLLKSKNIGFFEQCIRKRYIEIIKIFLKQYKLNGEEILSMINLACVNNNYEYIEFLLKENLYREYFSYLFFLYDYSDQISISVIKLFLKYNYPIELYDLYRFIKHQRKLLIKYLLTVESLKEIFSKHSREIFQHAAYHFEETNDFSIIEILKSSYLNDSWNF